MRNGFYNLIKIDKNEVLRYLEYKGQDISDNLEDTINKCIEITKEKINPRYTLRVYPISRTKEKEVKIEGTNLVIVSEDIYNLLKGCDSCAIMATTLGIEIEKEIRKNSYSELTKSIVIDACATTAIEEICDIVQDNLKEELKEEGKYITNRYSPGYGDLPLEVNRDITNILNSSKEIGLTITEKGIMLPRKSVTAIIGISETKVGYSKKTCMNCSNYNKCKYQKGDDNCEHKGIYKR
ncbi:MAG: vitamin B12 dependent-methionine synthase activation domain-containing protein [Peptostreptococcaceae bacterium]